MRTKSALIDAPSNLGLRPPQVNTVPGCYKMPWGLRNTGLAEALGAGDFGCVIPPRYDATWKPGGGTRNSKEIANYSYKLAEHINNAFERDYFPVIVGGDCSILLACGLALGEHGSHGLLFIDGHTDFRHIGNTGKIEAAAGEDLAISVGLGDPRLTNLSGKGVNFEPERVAALGARIDDEHLAELRKRSIFAAPSNLLMAEGQRTLSEALDIVTNSTRGFWVHLDLDVVDSSEMFVADSPERGDISFSVLSDILSTVVSNSLCFGMDVTIYDPDLDPKEVCAKRIVECLRNEFNS